MRIIQDKISLIDLKKMAEGSFGGLVKAVVDIGKEIMAVDAEMHADEEQHLIEEGSSQKDLWGINLYPDFFDKDEFIEFDSMINLRPWHNNRSRGVDDVQIQKRIVEIINKLVEK